MPTAATTAKMMNHSGWSSRTIFAPLSAMLAGVADGVKRKRNVPTIVQAPISAVETITIAFWRFRTIAAIAKIDADDDAHDPDQHIQIGAEQAEEARHQAVPE